MFRKCFTNCLRILWIYSKSTFTAKPKKIFLNYKNYRKLITDVTKPIRLKWLNKDVLYTESKYMISNLLMVTYYYKADTKKEADDILAELVDIIQSDLSDQNYENAENVLKISLKVAEEHHLYNLWSELSYTWALIALNQNQLEKAQNILVQTIEQLHIWGYQEDDHHIIDLKFCLANVMSFDDKIEMADMGFKTCLAQQETKISKDENNDDEVILYVDILLYYGLHMMRQKLYKEAKQNIDKAYIVMKNVKIAPVTKKIVILYKKAELNEKLGDYKTAFDDILEVTTLAKDTGSPDLPTCYKKLAEICIKMKLYPEAKNAYEEALKYATMFYKFDDINDLEEHILELEKYVK